jgi:hypothetical protein
MFCHVVAVETGAVVFLDQPEPVGVEPVKRGLPAIHVIEHAKLHRTDLPFD